MVTATRALTGGVGGDGSVDAPRLATLAQLAIDDVRHRVELQQRDLDPALVVVDVRVTAFVPATQEGTRR